MQVDFKGLWWMFLLVAIFSYLIGNVNFARIISKKLNRDITKEGSGNPGTMNMSRTFGLKIGLLTFILDVFKGALPTLIVKILFKDLIFAGSTLHVSVMAQYIAGFFVILGHIFPVIYSFKGGKGIACSIGLFLVTQPLVGVVSTLLALGFILLTAMGSMGSMIAITPPAIAELISLYKLGFIQELSLEFGTIFFIVTEHIIFLIMLLVWYASRNNLTKLISGDEHETSWLDMIAARIMQKKHEKLVKKEKALKKQNEKKN
ncbi:MAG: glycerol-3-phosphate acyltransferase [Clostridia bacterium]|nr:glycerol-3-phosphate acyltransferase [Clostridia bacterium]